MSKQKQLIYLTWIHFLLLLYPMAVKEIHFHVGKPLQTHGAAEGFVLAQYAADPCAICDFEFVPFIPVDLASIPSQPHHASLVACESVPFLSGNVASIIRLRAPPSYS